MAGDWFRIRRILTASAKRLALGGQRDDNFGSGLIDLLKALQLADLRAAMTALRQGSDKHLLEEEAMEEHQVGWIAAIHNRRNCRLAR